MAYVRKQNFEANDDLLRKLPEIPIDELGDSHPLEVVSDSVRIKDAMELEAFMNERVQIRVHASQMEGSLAIECLTLNGITQPIVRGVPTWVKRKYVELLGQGSTSKIQQRTNPYDLSDITITEQRAIAYPFDVLSDTDKGRKWLEGILKAD